MSVVSGVTGAVMGSDSSNKAAEAQTDAAWIASQTSLKMHDQSREDTAPWREAGEWALKGSSGYYAGDKFISSETPDNKTLLNLALKERSPYASDNVLQMMAFSMPKDERNALVDAYSKDNVTYQEGSPGLVNMIEQGPGEFIPEEDPGYKFGYEEFVEKPTLRAASAMGHLGGGRAPKELTRYASDYASTKYDNFLDRWYQSLAPRQSLAGVGQTSANQTAQNALITGQNVGQNYLAAGDARATGHINNGNTWSAFANQQGQNALDAYMMFGTGGGGNYAAAGGSKGMPRVAGY